MNVQIWRNSCIDVAPLNNEVVLFHPEANRFCLLNSSASFVWNQLEGPLTVTQVAEQICTHFNGIDKETASRDVESIVAELASLGCVLQGEQDGTAHPSAIASDAKSNVSYERPRLRVMTEQEVLSAFQVTAAGTTMWWV